MGLNEPLSRSNTDSSTRSRSPLEDATPKAGTVLSFRETVVCVGPVHGGHILGCLYATSLLKADLGLDWALIQLSDQAVFQVQYNLTKRDPRRAHGIASQILPSPNKLTSILSMTGYSGRMNGVLFPGSTMIRLSPSCKFQEVWTVQFDRPLGKRYPKSSLLSIISEIVQIQVILGLGWLMLFLEAFTGISLPGFLVGEKHI